MDKNYKKTDNWVRRAGGEARDTAGKDPAPKMRSLASFFTWIPLSREQCVLAWSERERAMAANQPFGSRAKTTCHPGGACLPARLGR